jgi:hypothetical protein
MNGRRACSGQVTERIEDGTGAVVPITDAPSEIMAPAGADHPGRPQPGRFVLASGRHQPLDHTPINSGCPTHGPARLVRALHRRAERSVRRPGAVAIDNESYAFSIQSTSRGRGGHPVCSPPSPDDGCGSRATHRRNDPVDGR